MASVPLYTVYGDATPFQVQLDPIGIGNVRLIIPEDYAGREVDEELPVAALQSLAGDEAFGYDDLLGLNLKTDGHKVTGLIGIGSGNEPFVLQRDDLIQALGALDAS